MKGYYEMDFLGAATTANIRESNSYTPRIRQAYFAYDDDNWHGHFSAGQMWSLADQNRVGILNGTENIPLTIDAQYVAGFNWARQPAIRYVQELGQDRWFGVSVEAPQPISRRTVTVLVVRRRSVRLGPAPRPHWRRRIVDYCAPRACRKSRHTCNAGGLLNT